MIRQRIYYMKRTFIIRNVILTILILAIIIGVSYYFITTNNKKYEIEKVEQYNYFLLKQDGKTGVIDRSGNIVIDVKYDDIKFQIHKKMYLYVIVGKIHKY